jgi:hypothetical protein
VCADGGPVTTRTENAMSEGLLRGAAERFRQLEEKCYTADHDDQHTHGELGVAAAQLLVAGTDERVSTNFHSGDLWGLEGKYRHDRIRALEIAVALAIAELDRELRRTPRDPR